MRQYLRQSFILQVLMPLSTFVIWRPDTTSYCSWYKAPQIYQQIFHSCLTSSSVALHKHSGELDASPGNIKGVVLMVFQ